MQCVYGQGNCAFSCTCFPSCSFIVTVNGTDMLLHVVLRFIFPSTCVAIFNRSLRSTTLTTIRCLNFTNYCWHFRSFGFPWMRVSWLLNCRMIPLVEMCLVRSNIAYPMLVSAHTTHVQSWKFSVVLDLNHSRGTGQMFVANLQRNRAQACSQAVHVGRYRRCLPPLILPALKSHG